MDQPMRVTLETLSPQSVSGFVVLEGVNGAGKTTLLSAMRDYGTTLCREIVTTREPGGTALGQTVRKLLLESPKGSVGTVCELLLFGADRAQHVETFIRPALQRNAIVLCDRYFYSTEAFQGFGRGIDSRLIKTVNETAIAGLIPDLVILLDLDPAEGLRRAGSADRAAQRDRMEDEEIEFHARIRRGFLTIAETRPEPFLVLDASRDRRELAEQACRALHKLYARV